MRFVVLVLLSLCASCSSVDTGPSGDSSPVASSELETPEQAAEIAVKVANGTATPEEARLLEAYINKKH